jgi:spermidine/putrescine transport system substrate-binding protein
MRRSDLLLASSLPLLSRRELARRALSLGAGAAALAAGARPRRAGAATQVNWLGWQGYDQPLRTEGFLERAGIELAATYLANNDEIVTKLAAQAPIDIVTPYMGYVPALREAELIRPIDPAKAPNLPKVVETFRNDANLYVDGTHWSVPITWGGGPMVYDPAVVQPTSWFDLEKPEHKGRIAMFDDAVGMMLTASIMVSGAEVASLVTPAQLEEVKKYCVKLKKEHARAVFPSYGEGADAMVRGEVVMTLGGAEWLPAIVAEKKRLAYTYPKEGCFGFIDSYVIPASGPNPDLAHAMADHMLTVPAQLELTKNNYAVITREAMDALAGPAATMYPYKDLASFGRVCKFFPMAPAESDGKVASWPEWLAAWQEVLAA